MVLNLNSLKDKVFWEINEIKAPGFNIDKMLERTKAEPVWLHFGAGNIFRGFIAELQNELLEKGLEEKGIIAADTFDYDIIDNIYKPFDNLTLLAGLKADGSMEKKIVASVADSIKADSKNSTEMNKLRDIFKSKSLELVSFTITEKGYSLTDIDGTLSIAAKADIENGPENPVHAMSIVTALLYERFKCNAAPIALVSMDNCSHNGEKLKSAVMTIAGKWQKRGYVDKEFISYIDDESRVSFPWSMIDKITPRPAKEVWENLKDAGLENMEPVITGKNTYIAPFVNAEIPSYLVIEDKFPNGRPRLECAGVYMTDRETVNNTERMKVTTCLNPLHTALAVFGCLLSYNHIAKEMQDTELKALVEKIGYEEGMPVVVNPGIIDPLEFIHEVIDIRLPNPFIPDMPQRIATDTSQKMSVRFGETIKSYMRSDKLDSKDLTYIPLVIAGWLRYLLGVDDNAKAMDLSADPMLAELKGYLKDIAVGGLNEDIHGKLKPILSNEVIFGVNLYEAGLGEKIEEMFIELTARKGAVREVLKKTLS